MISESFCDELIKISMDPETKQRLKNEAKLIGQAGAVAGATHGLWELGRYAAEKHYGKKVLQNTAGKAMRGGLPAAAAIGTYVATKAYQKGKAQDRKRLMEAAKAKGQ